MNTKKTSEDIDSDRRRFVETAAVGIAAAGSFGLLPKGTAAAEGDESVPSVSTYRRSNSSISASA